MYIKRFDDIINEEVRDIYDLNLSPKEEKIIEDEYFSLLGQSGELVKYLNARNYKLKFGMLRSLFKDAIAYKKQREYIKGGAKLLHRTIPMLLGPIFLPVYLLGKILGVSRALNKIIQPALNLEGGGELTYKNFLSRLLQRSMAIMEGDITSVLEEDWFYNIFFVEKGLLQMIKKEHFYAFANYLAKEMEKKPDDEDVSDFYVKNEFIKWLNNKFELNPPMQLEVSVLKYKSSDIIKEGIKDDDLFDEEDWDEKETFYYLIYTWFGNRGTVDIKTIPVTKQVSDGVVSLFDMNDRRLSRLRLKDFQDKIKTGINIGKGIIFDSTDVDDEKIVFEMINIMKNRLKVIADDIRRYRKIYNNDGYDEENDNEHNMNELETRIERYKVLENNIKTFIKNNIIENVTREILSELR